MNERLSAPLDPARDDDALENDRARMASRLIDAWIHTHGKQIPWAIAVEIVFIVTKMPPAERDRLLGLAEVPA